MRTLDLLTARGGTIPDNIVRLINDSQKEDTSSIDEDEAIRFNMDIANMMRLGVERDLDAVFILRIVADSWLLPVIVVGDRGALYGEDMREFFRATCKDRGMSFDEYVRDTGEAFAHAVDLVRKHPEARGEPILFIRGLNEAFRSFRSVRQTALENLLGMFGSDEDLRDYADEYDSGDCESCAMNSVCPGSKVSTNDGSPVVETFDLENWNPVGTVQ